MTVQVIHGDCRAVMPSLVGDSVQCVVTSPPYFGLRDYGVAGQIGLEPSPQAYVDEMVAVFREIRRVLRKDGTAWLNLGDSYANQGTGSVGSSAKSSLTTGSKRGAWAPGKTIQTVKRIGGMPPGIKPKDLMMIPARVALALQADGWWLRSEIIWSKAAPMPESVRDRPTCAHEKVWLLTKSATYFYDADAVRQPFSDDRMGCDGGIAVSERNRGGRSDGFTKPSGINPSANGGANLRNVWHLNPEPFPGAHFATMPATLAELCIKAGSRPGDTILDPFAGAGTTLLVADRLQRHAIGIELNPDYRELAAARVAGDAPLLASVA